MLADEHAPVLTLKERIAALQLAQATDSQAHNERLPGPKALKPAAPTPVRRQLSMPIAPNSSAPPVCRVPGDCDTDAKKVEPKISPRKWESRREEPPPLPARRTSQPAAVRPPALPPRRPSEMSVNRKQSNESISSVQSNRSSLSAVSSRTSLSAASESNIGTGSRFRVKAPEYDPAKLPALPERGTQRQSEDMERRAPLRPSISSPDTIPRLQEGVPPSLPVRRQEPLAHRTNNMVLPKPTRSALEFGFNNKETPPPVPLNRPRQSFRTNDSNAVPPPEQGVVELDANTFDDIILRSGKPAFVDFYAPFCKYCKELDPVYEELAITYQHKNITIAKIDSYGQKIIGERYEVNGWPQLKFFDGTGGPPVDFQWSRNIEWMSRFIDEQMAARHAAYGSPPPVPIASRPTC
ncbi:hypothetical protein BKA67DRAFT_647777 [Truncatella angustata]|uniref:Thioredoxin domain-containing protein n=1 Tax=Truncatella angustata TaxID=152316 RepID=A0A9P8UGK4_9PEZI|nr:uncharacterized protein BKA67DRAFT_647777 [Truncatella angustata]KAH6651805.1 hypothetical protein BKA67DRAFT_647777 [Truncatella angustata]KAH8196019.1 hypothetical protein TruAng_009826 [Truncatella angustata]